MSTKSKLITGQLISTISTGTAPFVIASTTQCTNLKAAVASNADSLKSATTAVVTTGASSSTVTAFLKSLTSSTAREGGWSVSVNWEITNTNTSVGSLNVEIDSTYVQRFTGTTASMTCDLPGTETTNYTGCTYFFINNSTQTVTIRAHDASTVIAMATNTAYIVTCITPGGTTNAAWIKIGSMAVI